jgi:DNA-binding NarL/FixJ family response regulator
VHVSQAARSLELATTDRAVGGRIRRQGSAPEADPNRGSGRTAAATDADLIRVLIVDDHSALAGALAFTIDGYPDLRCVGTAGNLAQAGTMIDQLRPDVILLDVLLPDGNGIEAIPSIVAANPGVRVLVLTGHTDVDLLSRAASHGASGFLPKESSIPAVIGAIRAAVSGQMLVDGPTLATILGRLADTSRRTTPAPSGVTLTRRETDVLRLMGEGMDPQAISPLLGISLNTCRGYQKTLMAKLGAHSQLEAVVIGTRMGLLAR